MVPVEFAVPSIESIPLTVVVEVMVFVFAPESTRLLNVSAGRVCADAELNSTVPLDAVKPAPVPVATVPAALKMILLEPPLRVPAVLVQVPVKLCVREVPRFSVPPVPVKLKPPADTLPVKVAVPAVFDSITLPVVVNPPIFWLARVPVIVIDELPAVKVPELMKSP